MWNPLREDLKIEPEFKDLNWRAAIRFSIRELLLVMTIGGLSVGWFLDRRALQNDRRLEISLLESKVTKLEGHNSWLQDSLASLVSELRDEYQIAFQKYGPFGRVRLRKRSEIDPARETLELGNDGETGKFP